MVKEQRKSVKNFGGGQQRNSNLELFRIITYFNPHFRKGSDGILIRSPTVQTYFNPHFRKGSIMVS